MIGRSEMWNLVEPVAQACGVSLFDIDMPKGQSGVLRIYIAHADAKSHKDTSVESVSLEDCEKVSRHLSAMPEFEEVLPERVTLEVSSPGVNRKLRLADHFSGAVGERIKLKARGESGMFTIFGELVSFDGTTAEVLEDKTGDKHSICFDDIREARVDFIFQ